MIKKYCTAFEGQFGLFDTVMNLKKERKKEKKKKAEHCYIADM